MKTNTSIKLIGAFSLSAILVSTQGLALTQSEKQALRESIAGVPNIELATECASLVKTAGKKDQEATALTLVREAVTKAPATAESVVASLAAVLPQSAHTIAATAADLAPRQMLTIAQAAAKAAPASAGKIAQALARLSPQKSVDIASAIIAVAPASSSEVSTVAATAPLRVERRNAQISGGTVTTTPNIGIDGEPKIVEGAAIDLVSEGYATVGGDSGR